MKRLLILFMILFLLSCSNDDDATPTTLTNTPPMGNTDNDPGEDPVDPVGTPAEYRGLDLSFSSYMADSSVVYKDMTGAIIPDIYAYSHSRGVNLVRLRAWVNPSGMYNRTADLLPKAQEAHDAGMDILLDLHYSDTWADPGQQAIPSTWDGTSVTALSADITSYTTDLLQLLQAQGTPPSIVQLGNEINQGLLWPIGMVSSATDPNLPAMNQLIQAGIDAVRTTVPNAQIMLHIADPGFGEDFFNDYLTVTDYDIAGLSYYPAYHNNSVAQLGALVQATATASGRPVMLAEVAYPFTLGFNDNTNNIVGLNSQLEAGYPASEQGQLDFMRDVLAQMETLPAGMNAGFVYWAPDWIAGGSQGSPWENMALWDFDSEAVTAWTVFAP